MTENVVHPTVRNGTAVDADGMNMLTVYEGKTPDLFPTYYRFSNYDQLLMPIAGSQKESFTIMTWFKMHSDLFYEE